MSSAQSSEAYNEVIEDICSLLRKETLWSSELEKVLQGYKKAKGSSKKKQLVFEYSETDSDSDSHSDNHSESESDFDIQALPLGGLELFKPDAGSYHQEESTETVSVCSLDSLD